MSSHFSTVSDRTVRGVTASHDAIRSASFGQRAASRPECRSCVQGAPSASSGHRAACRDCRVRADRSHVAGRMPWQTLSELNHAEMCDASYPVRSELRTWCVEPFAPRHYGEKRCEIAGLSAQLVETRVRSGVRSRAEKPSDSAVVPLGASVASGVGLMRRFTSGQGQGVDEPTMVALDVALDWALDLGKALAEADEARRRAYLIEETPITWDCPGYDTMRRRRRLRSSEALTVVARSDAGVGVGHR